MWDLFTACCRRNKTAHLPKDLLVDGEGEVQHVLDVVVLHPLQALVELLVQELQVTQVTWAAAEGQT